MMTKKYTVLLGLPLLLNSSCFYSRYDKTHWDTYIGTIYEVSNSLKMSWISFRANGTIISEAADSYSPALVEGEKYIVYYDKQNPSRFSIDFTQPLFDTGEAICWGIGKIKKIYEKSFFNPSPSLVFKYKTNKHGEIYERYLTLPDDFRQMYPNLKVGQMYNVDVWCENTNRAIIRLDLPPVQKKAIK